MPKLIVNPDTAAAWEIPLESGTTSLGRSEESVIPIAHESISSLHCEVIVQNGAARIRDLGSRNGTFVNGELVEDAPLRNGMLVRLGDITMRYQSDESETPAGTTVPPGPSRITVPVSGNCKYHPRSPGRFSCPKCRLLFCELCVNVRSDKGRAAQFCRSCGSECIPVETCTAEAEEVEESFPKLVRGAFSYPFKNDGVYLLVIGGIFFLLIDGAKYLAHFAFGYGVMAFLLLTVFGSGYLVVYLRGILTSSAEGENRMPDWPEMTDFAGDVVVPFLQLFGTVLVCFAPAILLAIFAPDESSWLGWALFAFVLIGCAYFPMAFMAVAMFDSIMALNPLVIIPSILRIPGAYLFTMVLFALILLLRWLGATLLPTIVSPRILCWAIFDFLGLYLLIVEARILGLLYRTKKAELGWFNR